MANDAMSAAPPVKAAPELPAEQPTHDRATPYAWYVLGFLTAASVLSTIDRQVLSVMIGPLKRDLGISDTEVGLLGGLAFTLLYSAFTLPAAWIADQKSRSVLVSAAIFFWSLMTAACGMATSFVTLFLARMGVGLGEAALPPAAYSMMSDLFPRRTLPIALGLFASAPFIGVGIASIAGGRLAQYFEEAPAIVVPLLGEVETWQAVFLLLGVPGLFLALLGALTLREPARKGQVSGEKPTPLTLRQMSVFLAGRRRFLGLHFIAYIAMSIQGWGLFFWVIEFLVRERGMERADAGLYYGLMAFTLGLAGGLISGQLASRLLARGRADSTMRLALVAILVLAPLAVMMPIVPSAWMTLALIAPITFFMGWPGGLGTAALQFIVPNELKGRIIALYMLVVNCVSLTLGPLLGGVISDQVFNGQSLGGSLALMAAVNYPLAAICLMLSLRPYRAALEQAKAWQDPD